MVKRVLAFAAIAVVALLGAGCTSTSSPIYPMTVGSVWHMSMYTLSGTTTASLDTVSTGTQTNTATDTAHLANGEEVTKFQNDLTTHFRTPDTTIMTTSYSYVAEVGDTIFSYSDLNDTTGTPVMRSSPAAGQTWAEGSGTATVIGQEDVTVAAGTYKGAWKVMLTMSINGASADVYEWYASGTGLVKVSYDYTSGGYETTYNSELTSATIK